MEDKTCPKVMQLIGEAETLINRLDDKLSHVLLPPYPVEANNTENESTITRKLRTILCLLTELNDRVEQ